MCRLIQYHNILVYYILYPHCITCCKMASNAKVNNLMMSTRLVLDLL